MICPTCNGTGHISVISTVDELIATYRRSAKSDVYVYEGGTTDGKHYSGKYFLTRVGGEISPEVVREAISTRILVPQYPADPTAHAWRFRRLTD